MKNLFVKILCTILFILLSGCQTVTQKIDQTTELEKKELSKWLNKSEEELKIKFGKPDQVELKINSKNRFYIYTKEKLKIKCQRVFEIDPGNKVIGFTSKNCF